MEQSSSLRYYYRNKERLQAKARERYHRKKHDEERQKELLALLEPESLTPYLESLALKKQAEKDKRDMNREKYLAYQREYYRKNGAVIKEKRAKKRREDKSYLG